MGGEVGKWALRFVQCIVLNKSIYAMLKLGLNVGS